MSDEVTPHADPQVRRRFFSLPASATGWLSVALVLAAVALVAVMAVFLDTLMTAAIEWPWFGSALAIAIYVCLFGAALSGLAALTVKHERSWMVIIATVVPFAVIASEAVQVVSSL